MNLKHIKRTANFAWSPKNIDAIYLASGTSAEQLDASFDTSSFLEIYELQFDNYDKLMPLKVSVNLDLRFHKLIWSSFQGNQEDFNNGIIVGGADKGNILIYNVSQLLQGKNEIVSCQTVHKGSVGALDFNAFQPNLLASGASESELFIWDLNALNSPMSPGSVIQPLETITSVAWNQQVQHILASSSRTTTVIWDLRKNEPIIKICDTSSPMHCKTMAWHPEIATQICLASENDHYPILKLWDLRFSTSPLKLFEQHQKGILSIAWSTSDPDLLLSCGKDPYILCWNPNDVNNINSVQMKIITSDQWNFEVAWCNQNPALLACASFEGLINVYSILGSGAETEKETFPIWDATVQHKHSILKKAPRWMKLKTRSTFGFGGMLVFYNPIDTKQTVALHQVLTETEMLIRSRKLENCLFEKTLQTYCEERCSMCSDLNHKMIWSFLCAQFKSSPYSEVVNVLKNNKTFKIDGNFFSKNFQLPQPCANAEFDDLKKSEILLTETDIENQIIETLASGQLETAVNYCYNYNRIPEAIFLSIIAGHNSLGCIRDMYLQNKPDTIKQFIAAIISGNWEQIIEQCDLLNWHVVLSLILTYAVEEMLGTKLSETLNPEMKHAALLCFICAGSISDVATCQSSDDDLTEKAEQLIVLSASLQYHNIPVTVGKVAENVLYHFLLNLISQGELQSAYNYIGEIDSILLQNLKIRLQHALNNNLLTNLTSNQSMSKNYSLYTHELLQNDINEHRYSVPVISHLVTPSVNTASSSFNSLIPNDFSCYSRGWNDPPLFNRTSKNKIKTSFEHHAPITEPLANMPGVNANNFPLNEMQKLQKTSVETSLSEAVLSQQGNQIGSSYSALTSPTQSFSSSAYTYESSQFLPNLAYSSNASIFSNLASNESLHQDSVITSYAPLSSNFSQFSSKNNSAINDSTFNGKNCSVHGISDEHKIIKDIFDDLKLRCEKSCDQSQQIKRKLEDVSRKLEVLYEKLCTNQLTSVTLKALHEIVQCVKSHNYPTANMLQAKLATTGDFAEISSFLPGIKILLQLSMQLKV